MKSLFLVVLGLAALWAPLAWNNVGGQRQLFMCEGCILLCDYWIPRTCAAQGYTDVDYDEKLDNAQETGWKNGKLKVAAHDRPYPAFALLPMRLFPYTSGGAWLYTALMAIGYVVLLCLFGKTFWPLALLVSMPVLYNVERGNPIGFTAIFVAVFLLWWNHPDSTKRKVAAVALAVATAMKLTPCLLGALYLPQLWRTRGRFAEPFIAGFAAIVLLIVPFGLMPDGFAGMPKMIANAAENGLFYARCGDFGLLPFWRAVRVLLHQDCTIAWPGCLQLVRLMQIVGFAAVLYGGIKQKMKLLVFGAMMAPGNMFYYGVLYFVPLLVHDLRRLTLVSFVSWVVILSPFQFCIAGQSGNGLLVNVAIFALIIEELFLRKEKSC